MSQTSQPDRPTGGKPSSCVLVIVGATGDLARRKLAPAIWNLHRLGQLPDNFAIIGCSRHAHSDQQFRQSFGDSIRQHDEEGGFDEALFAALAGRLFFQRADFANPPDVRGLGDRLAELRREHGLAPNVLFYLATPPGQFEPTIRAIGQAGLANQPGGWSRLIIEKPFGHDLPSARRLDDAMRSVFGEAASFRIDHYLGKETVQNLMVLRFSNSIFELIWNREHVDHVQITVAETLGVAGRAAFFEQTGILRDVAQNHLMQLLTLIAMEPPGGAPDGVRDEKVKVLRSLRRLQPGDVVAAQYGAGTIAGQPVVGYRHEEGVASDSLAETYLAVRAFVDSWRWAGVPFYLRCGKRLARKVTEIAIQFQKPPLSLFEMIGCEQIQPNRLIIRVQPDEGIALVFGAKAPGPRVCVEPVKMDFSYRGHFGRPPPDAYQRLLLDVMAGNPTLFLRYDAVEEAWAYFQPILDRWQGGDKPLAFYPAGSWGPPQGDALLTDGQDQWRNP